MGRANLSHRANMALSIPAEKLIDAIVSITSSSVTLGWELQTDGVQKKKETPMRTKTHLIAVVFTLVAVASASNQKLAPELQNRTNRDSVDVIVQFHSRLTARHHQMVASHGGHLKHELGLVKAAAYSVPAAALTSLAKDPDVAYISPDRPLKGMGTVSSITALDYHTDTVNAPYGWGLGLDGTGIGVAIIDSGIFDMPDLHGAGPGNSGKSRVVYKQNFTSLNLMDAYDQFGHGTHVAGIVGGDGNKSTGNQDIYTFKGIAPNVNLINLRVLDQNGAGTDSEVINAIQTAILLKSIYNIRVINLSLGRPVYESYTLDPLCQAVEAAYQAGIVVVVAAGNDGRDNSAGTNGYGTITSPANDPYVITVGAMKTMGTSTRADDLIATYSSKGPTAIDHLAKPDLVAPGNQIISLYSPGLTLAKLYPGNEIPHSLYETNGGASSVQYVFCVERHQHGHSGGQRRGGLDAATKPCADAGSGQGHTYADGIQDLSTIQHVHRSDDGHYLYRSVRRLHGRGRLSGYSGSIAEHAISARAMRCRRSPP